jgi:fibronectin type 3 domain-containing protein
VTAVDTSGNESVASATVSAIRTSDSTAPDAPASFTANGASVGISLDWANNTESDLAGYNIYRSDSFGGTYVKLNSTLLGSSDFFDSSAPTGAASYYRVTAVDTVGNESAASTINATRQSSDQTAPAVPSGRTTAKAIWRVTTSTGPLRSSARSSASTVACWASRSSWTTPRPPAR